jgi:hypothetical protein
VPISASASEARFSVAIARALERVAPLFGGQRRLAQQQLAAERPGELQRPVGGAPDTGAQRRLATRLQRAANRATATLKNR